MSQPKRYNLRLPQITYGMEESQDGEYVYHSDYAALAAENERLKETIQGERAIHRQNTYMWKDSIERFRFDYLQLNEENERLRKAGEWQSKDTIPKEGVDVLCWSGDFMFVGWVNQYGTWHSSDDSRFVPDCWMPLPQPPSKEGRDAK